MGFIVGFFRDQMSTDVRILDTTLASLSLKQAGLKHMDLKVSNCVHRRCLSMVNFMYFFLFCFFFLILNSDRRVKAWLGLIVL